MRSALLIGNSDGIGRELTQLLLEEGWHVTGISRRALDMRSPAYEHHLLDVCSDEYPAALAAIVCRIEPLDVCVYCAGTGEPIDVATLTTEQRVFQTNLMGLVISATTVIPAMVRAKRGHLIGLSSQADALISAVFPSYSASKAGVSSYLEGLAEACRPSNVYVTNLRFGFVDTKLAKSSVRPFMISRLAAAQRIRRCIERRPRRDTYPKRMALLLAAVRAATAIKRWVAA